MEDGADTCLLATGPGETGLMEVDGRGSPLQQQLAARGVRPLAHLIMEDVAREGEQQEGARSDALSSVLRTPLPLHLTTMAAIDTPELDPLPLAHAIAESQRSD